MLELLHKFTPSELIRPHLGSVVPLLLHLARTDAEDMAVTSIKMFMELFRASRQLMDSQIPLFIGFAVDLFKESPAYVEELFSPTGAAMVEPDRTVFPKAFPSLKLLSETLVLCNFLYQMGGPALIAQFPTHNLVDAAAKVLYVLLPCACLTFLLALHTTSEAGDGEGRKPHGRGYHTIRSSTLDRQQKRFHGVDFRTN